MAPSLHSAMVENIGASITSSPNDFIPRALFSRAISTTDNITCARPIPDLVGGPLYANSDITFHQLMIYICAPCLGLTIISAVYLSWQHVRNYTAPQEQRQILRIIALPVFYSLFNFLALCWYSTYQYIQPLSGLYESFAVAALFFLILEWVCPEGTDRNKYFEEFPFKDKKGVIIEGGSLAWFQRTWTQIFQYPLIKLVFTIIEIVTQYYGDYCSNSFSPKHAHLWLFLAGIFIVAGALEATGAFARRMKSEMSGTHKERVKIYCFLGIVFFQIIQDIIFSILNGKLFSPTRLLTYNDINYGMRSFLTCLEAIAFSILFHWAYSATEFKNRTDRYLQDQRAPRIGTWCAVRDAIDLSDIANAIWVALGFAWTGLVRWSNGSSKTSGSGAANGSNATNSRKRNANKGPIGAVIGMAIAAVEKRRGQSDSSRGEQQISPFDDSMAAVGPTMPDTTRTSAPGRVRTFNGHDDFGMPMAYGGQRTEYEPLRGNTSRDSSLSDRQLSRH